MCLQHVLHYQVQKSNVGQGSQLECQKGMSTSGHHFVTTSSTDHRNHDLTMGRTHKQLDQIQRLQTIDSVSVDCHLGLVFESMRIIADQDQLRCQVVVSDFTTM